MSPKCSDVATKSRPMSAPAVVPSMTYKSRHSSVGEEAVIAVFRSCAPDPSTYQRSLVATKPALCTAIRERDTNDVRVERSRQEKRLLALPASDEGSRYSNHGGRY